MRGKDRSAAGTALRAKTKQAKRPNSTTTPRANAAQRRQYSDFARTDDSVVRALIERGAVKGETRNKGVYGIVCPWSADIAAARLAEARRDFTCTGESESEMKGQKK